MFIIITTHLFPLQIIITDIQEYRCIKNTITPTINPPPPFAPGALAAFQHFVSSDHGLVKFDHECCALVPVDSDLGRKATVGENSFHDSSSKGCTVQCAVLFWNRDKHVDQWILFNNVVGLIIIISLLKFVRLFAKQGFPDGDLWSTKLSAKWRGQMLKMI